MSRTFAARSLRNPTFGLIALGVLGACAAPAGGPPLPPGPGAGNDPCFAGREVPPRMDDGRPFPDLEAYLEHRRRLGAADHPFYGEVRPGVYRCMMFAPPSAQPTQEFTRAELAAKYRLPDS